MLVNATELSKKADCMSSRFVRQSVLLEHDVVRDLVDLASGGELDCVELDILSSMVFIRMKAAYSASGETA